MVKVEDSCTPGTGNDNQAVAGSSGIINEAALAHAPTLTERSLREHGIPLQQAIEQVHYVCSIAKVDRIQRALVSAPLDSGCFEIHSFFFSFFFFFFV